MDVAKAWLDVAVRPSGEQRRLDTAAARSATLVVWVQLLGPQLMVVEATGGEEIARVAQLGIAPVAVAVINPRPVRECARATGRLAQTDRLDAQVLAHWGEALRPIPRPWPDAAAQEGKALRERRRQRVAMRTAEANRLGPTRVDRVRTRIPAQLAWLQTDRAAGDDDLRQRLRASPLWREREDLLRRVPGIGRVRSLTLVAERAELGRLCQGPSATLVGGAPLKRASGTLRGRRAVCGGGTTRRADDAVHGDAARHALYSGHPCVLRAPAGGGLARRRWRWWPAGASCSPSATPCSNIAPPGRLRRPEPARG